MLKQHGRISVCLLALWCPNNTLWVHLLYLCCCLVAMPCVSWAKFTWFKIFILIERRRRRLEFASGGVEQWLTCGGLCLHGLKCCGFWLCLTLRVTLPCCCSHFLGLMPVDALAVFVIHSDARKEKEGTKNQSNLGPGHTKHLAKLHACFAGDNDARLTIRWTWKPRGCNCVTRTLNDGLCNSNLIISR